MNGEKSAAVQVVGIGEILWDMLPDGRRIGGAPANFAYHVNARGVPAAVVSSVGDDALGHEILESLSAWKLNARYVSVQSAYPTGVVQIQLDANGIPKYIIEENAAWDHITWSEQLEALAVSLRAICFGTLGQRAPESRATIQRFVDATPSGCLRVCDINLRQFYFNADVLRESLQLATVLKLNHEELPIVAQIFNITGDTHTMLAHLRDQFDLTLVALTRGDLGSVLLTRITVSEHPGFPVKVVDTIGAGDAFTAALVVGVLRNDDLDKINEDSNRAAAEVCSHAGAIPVVESESS